MLGFNRFRFNCSRSRTSKNANPFLSTGSLGRFVYKYKGPEGEDAGKHIERLKTNQINGYTNKSARAEIMGDGKLPKVQFLIDYDGQIAATDGFHGDFGNIRPRFVKAVEASVNQNEVFPFGFNEGELTRVRQLTFLYPLFSDGAKDWYNDVKPVFDEIIDNHDAWYGVVSGNYIKKRLIKNHGLKMVREAKRLIVAIREVMYLRSHLVGAVTTEKELQPYIDDGFIINLIRGTGDHYRPDRWARLILKGPGELTTGAGGRSAGDSPTSALEAVPADKITSGRSGTYRNVVPTYDENGVLENSSGAEIVGIGRTGTERKIIHTVRKDSAPVEVADDGRGGRLPPAARPDAHDDYDDVDALFNSDSTGAFDDILGANADEQRAMSEHVDGLEENVGDAYLDSKIDKPKEKKLKKEIGAARKATPRERNHILSVLDGLADSLRVANALTDEQYGVAMRFSRQMRRRDNMMDQLDAKDIDDLPRGLKVDADGVEIRDNPKGNALDNYKPPLRDDSGGRETDSDRGSASPRYNPNNPSGIPPLTEEMKKMGNILADAKRAAYNAAKLQKLKIDKVHMDTGKRTLSIKLKGVDDLIVLTFNQDTGPFSGEDEASGRINSLKLDDGYVRKNGSFTYRYKLNSPGELSRILRPLMSDAAGMGQGEYYPEIKDVPDGNHNEYLPGPEKAFQAILPLLKRVAAQHPRFKFHVSTTNSEMTAFLGGDEIAVTIVVNADSNGVTYQITSSDTLSSLSEIKPFKGDVPGSINWDGSPSLNVTNSRQVEEFLRMFYLTLHKWDIEKLTAKTISAGVGGFLSEYNPVKQKRTRTLSESHKLTVSGDPGHYFVLSFTRDPAHPDDVKGDFKLELYDASTGKALSSHHDLTLKFDAISITSDVKKIKKHLDDYRALFGRKAAYENFRSGGTSGNKEIDVDAPDRLKTEKVDEISPERTRMLEKKGSELFKRIASTTQLYIDYPVFRDSFDRFTQLQLKQQMAATKAYIIRFDPGDTEALSFDIATIYITVNESNNVTYRISHNGKTTNYQDDLSALETGMHNVILPQFRLAATGHFLSVLGDKSGDGKNFENVLYARLGRGNDVRFKRQSTALGAGFQFHEVGGNPILDVYTDTKNVYVKDLRDTSEGAKPRKIKLTQFTAKWLYNNAMQIVQKHDK